MKDLVLDIKLDIKNYLDKTEKYSTIRFTLEMWVLMLMSSIPAIFLAAILTELNLYTEPSIEYLHTILDQGLIITVLVIIILASLETILGQWLPVWLVSRFTKNKFKIVIISAVLFGIYHFELAQSASAFMGGIILAWAFLTYRKKSRSQAFLVTTTIHILNNLVAFYLLSLTR